MGYTSNRKGHAYTAGPQTKFKERFPRVCMFSCGRVLIGYSSHENIKVAGRWNNEIKIDSGVKMLINSSISEVNR